MAKTEELAEKARRYVDLLEQQRVKQREILAKEKAQIELLEERERLALRYSRIVDREDRMQDRRERMQDRREASEDRREKQVVIEEREERRRGAVGGVMGGVGRGVQTVGAIGQGIAMSGGSQGISSGFLGAAGALALGGPKGMIAAAVLSGVGAAINIVDKNAKRRTEAAPTVLENINSQALYKGEGGEQRDFRTGFDPYKQGGYNYGKFQRNAANMGYTASEMTGRLLGGDTRAIALLRRQGGGMGMHPAAIHKYMQGLGSLGPGFEGLRNQLLEQMLGEGKGAGGARSIAGLKRADIAGNRAYQRKAFPRSFADVPKRQREAWNTTVAGEALAGGARDLTETVVNSTKDLGRAVGDAVSSAMDGTKSLLQSIKENTGKISSAVKNRALQIIEKSETPRRPIMHDGYHNPHNFNQPSQN